MYSLLRDVVHALPADFPHVVGTLGAVPDVDGTGSDVEQHGRRPRPEVFY